MGWCSATEIVDTAITGAIRAVAEAWQIASGMDGARTPEFANALNRDPELQGRLDDVLRPFVRTISRKLNDGDWDCQSDSDYYDRFGQEMHDFSDQEWADYQKEQAD